jgi:hypothetical protein
MHKIGGETRTLCEVRHIWLFFGTSDWPPRRPAREDQPLAYSASSLVLLRCSHDMMGFHLEGDIPDVKEFVNCMRSCIRPLAASILRISGPANAS